MNFIKLFFLLFILFLLNGCVYNGEFAYLPNYRYINQKEVKPYKVAILPFEDRRGNINKDGMMLSLIPLMPFGPIKYQKVELGTSFFGHESFSFNPSVDIPQALVTELDNNKIFEKVVYASLNDTADVDFIIKGEIIDLTYKGKFLSYGLSSIGISLLITGIPAGIINNYVNIKISVFDVKQNNELFNYIVEGESKLVVGLYYKMMNEFIGYTEIMNKGFKNFVIQLNNKID